MTKINEMPKEYFEDKANIFNQTLLILFNHQRTYCCYNKMGCANLEKEHKYPYTDSIEYPWETNWQRYYDQASTSTESLIEIRDQKQMEKRLHRFQVAIVWLQPKTKIKVKGSGLLISNNLILTCAHNFYFKQKITTNCSIQIYPGQFGPLIRPYKVQQLYIPQGYRDNPKPQNATYDYALVKLTQKTSAREFIKLIWNYQSKLNNKVALYGYPGNSYKKKINQPFDSVYLEGQSSNKPIQIDQTNQTLIHTIPTLIGQSGSPLILCQPLANNLQCFSVIGIHKGQINYIGKNLKLHIARRLTKQLIQELEVQTIKMRAEMFESVNMQEQTQEIRQLKPLELFQRAKRYQKNRLYSSAFACYQKLQKELKIIPSNEISLKAQILNSYALCLNELKLYEEASKNLRLALQILKKLQTYQQLGNALNEAKEYSQTVSVLEQGIKQGYMSANIYNCLGLAKTQLKNIKEAIQYFKKAIEKDQKHLLAYYNLANAYRINKQYQLAYDNFKKSIKINEKLAQAYCGFGNIYYAQKKYERAIQEYQKSIQINPNYISGYSNLANTYKELNNNTKAIQYYTKILTINPNYKYTHCNLAIIYKETKAYEEAIYHFTMFVNIDPNNSEGENNLATAYVLAGKYEQAITHYKKAVQLKPSNFEALLNLGNTYMQIREYGNAIHYYRQAKNKNPKSLQANFRLGLAYKEQNSLAQARISFQNCIKINPQFTAAIQQTEEIDRRLARFIPQN